ncbi:MAG: hypothetical protein AAGB11_06595 [Pseudomonadota bacterium]
MRPIVNFLLAELSTADPNTDESMLFAALNGNKALYSRQQFPADIRHELSRDSQVASQSDQVIAVFDRYLDKYVLLKPRGFWENLRIMLPSAGGAAVLLIVIVVLGVMLFFLHDNGNITELGDPKIARGLITFVITVGTMGIAFTLIGGVFISSKDSVRERSEAGAQVLTALIAVLGTIVGFYYGSTLDGGAAPAIARQVVSPPELVEGGTFDVGAVVTGGVAPYAYTITGTVGAGDAQETLISVTGTSATGVISEKIELGDKIQVGSEPVELTIKLETTDAQNTSVAANSTTVKVLDGPDDDTSPPEATPGTPAGGED